MGQVTQYLRNNNNLNPREKQLFYDGFSLLDEATTQDRAEEIAYFYAHKHRPNITKYSDPRGMYGGDTYQTNFDFSVPNQEIELDLPTTSPPIIETDNLQKYFFRD